MSIREYRGSAADPTQGVVIAADSVHRRVKRWLHAAALALGALLVSQAGPAAAALSPPTVDACPSSGDPPIDPGSTRTHPGHWHNPKRSGTGWDFSILVIPR